MDNIVIPRMPGFYVEGKPYGNRIGQARARAEFLAAEYSRAVDIVHTTNGLTFETYRTVYPKQGRAPRVTSADALNSTPRGTNLLRHWNIGESL